MKYLYSIQNNIKPQRRLIFIQNGQTLPLHSQTKVWRFGTKPRPCAGIGR